MRILGIETSCDETAMSIVDIDNTNINVLSNVISSQMGIHKAFGGVVPEVAARNHAERIQVVLDEALKGTPAGDGSDIDLIAVTRGPGLKTSLLVGTTVAQTMGLAWDKPVIGVNHLEGHVLSPFIEHDIYPVQEGTFPMVVLTVSGGHTQIILVREIGSYEILGTTIDDAAGEAFDKVAKMIGGEYPGGPVIDKLAKNGNPQAFDFPRPMLHKDNFDFSFSGLKTSVKYKIRDLGIKDPRELTVEQKQDIAASFQRAVVDVLVKKTLKAAKVYSANTVLLAGGVGANSELRDRIESDTKQLQGVKSVLIDRQYSTDNAVMIAVAGYFEWQRHGMKAPDDIFVDPKLRFS
jgi:N6-L-threonylcarbamoyladenine synthase